MRKIQPKIRSITVARLQDEDPDLSWLGRYSNTPSKPEVTIDLQTRGDRGRNEYRYFIAANSAEETGNPESVEQDYERSESLNRGDWWFIGIIAKAKVQICDTEQTITSGGLWGIESDSGSEYIETVEAEQLNELRYILLNLGCSKAAIDAAISARKVNARSR
jgi:hypothetical protein